MIDENIREKWQRRVEDMTGTGDIAQELVSAVRALSDFWPQKEATVPIPRLREILGYGTSVFDDAAVAGFLAAQEGSLESWLTISLYFARVGFISPEATLPVHDAVADGWLRGKASARLSLIDREKLTTAPLEELRRELGVPERLFDWRSAGDVAPLLLEHGPLPETMPSIFWKVVANDIDPGTITPIIAQLGTTFDEPLKDACARAVLRHEEQREIANQPWPPRTIIEDLAHYPKGTLGYAYYHLIVDNGFDPEVLDPDSVSGFHPLLDGTNRRILQQHELWHLVAGYSTSPLHETAISSFQLAQFSHNYSAMFLATVVTLLTLTSPMFLDPILQVMSEAWQHGRTTRPMMQLEWEQLWGMQMDEIRQQYGIKTFESIVPDVMAA